MAAARAVIAPVAVLAGVVFCMAWPDGPPSPGDRDAPGGPRFLASPDAASVFERARASGLAVVSGKRYRVLCDRPDEVAAIAAHAELAASVLATLVGGLPATDIGGIVRIADDDRGRALETEFGVGADSTGTHGSAAFYSSRSGLIHLRPIGASVDPRLEQRIVAHEVAHHVVRHLGYPALSGPGAWVDEGVPLLMETLSDGGEFRVEPTFERMIQARELALADLLLPLTTFLGADRATFEAMPMIGVAYTAGSVALVRQVPLNQVQGTACALFLATRLGGRLGPVLRGALREGFDSGCAMRELGLDAAALDAAFRSFVLAPPTGLLLAGMTSFAGARR